MNKLGQIARGRTREGSALVAAGILMLLISILATSLSDSTTSNLQMQIRRRDDIRLMRTAESGVNLTFRHFQQNWGTLTNGALKNVDDVYDMDLTSEIPNATLNGCRVEANIEKVYGITAEDSSYIITATSHLGDRENAETYRRHRIQISITPHPRELFTHAMFAREGFTFGGAAGTDSYDSRVGDGTYDSSAPGSNGDLGSEGDIQVDKEENVNGAVRDNLETPTPEFDYEATKAAAGSMYELGEYVLAGGMKTNDFKSYVDDLAANPTANPATVINAYASAGDILDLTEANSPYHADKLDIKDGVIRIHGDVEIYCDGYVAISDAYTVYDEDSLTYPKGSRLAIYQGDYEPADSKESEITWNGQDNIGDIHTQADGTVMARPDRFLFMTEDDSDIHLNGNGDAALMIYAPNANFQLNGTFQFFGSMICQRFGSAGNAKVNGTFDFHYDEALSDYKPDLTPRLVIVGWRSFKLGYSGD